MALTDDAIDKIKQMIVDGDLGPGDRLPREAEFAERLGLSRSSMREAIRALALVNILDVRQGDGTYVTSLEPGLLLDVMSFTVDLHRDDSILEFFEVRRILEPRAAERAAELMSDDDAGALVTLLDGPQYDTPLDELVANDREFHRRIAQGSGNSVLYSLIEAVSAPTQRARVWRGLTQENAVARTIDEHRAIARAIAAREPEAARAWATVHIAGIESWVRLAILASESAKSVGAPVSSGSP